MPKVIHQKSKKPLYIIYSLLSVSILSLVFINSTYADNVDYSVVVEPVLNITTSGDTEGVVSLDLNPETKAFDSKNLTVTVGTNNQTGYQLIVSTPNNTTNLAEKNDSSLYIETLSSEVPENNFTPNHWGYKLNSSSTNYIPFVSGALVNSSNTATAGVSSTLTFGAKANYDTKAGSYAIALNFQATANPPIPTMQDLNPTLCTTTPTIVEDKRDGKEYTIAKLADGNCWMISDLNLAGGTKLYSETSDVPTGYPKSGGTGYYTLPTSSSTGFSDDTVAYVYNTGRETSSQSDCTSSQACNSYYSWLAAVAGNQTSVSTDGYNAPYSICPKGWRLPTATTSNASATSNNNWKTGDLYALATAYGANLASNYYDNSGATGANFYNNAGPGMTPNFLLAGYYNNSQLNNGGSGGYYWSSSSRSSTNAYNLGFRSSNVYSAGYDTRRVGFPVRCILKKTMQNFTTADAAAMNVGDTKTLTDSRDGQTYTVAKLADGNVWMLDNLRLSSTSVGLTNENSNVAYTSSNAWYLPSSSSSGFNSYNTKMINTQYIDTTTTSYGSGSGKTGVYYNYCAATAGTYCYNSDSGIGDAQYDVCPKGWRMPTGGSSGEYQALYTAYSSNDSNFRVALSTPLSGYYNNSSVSSRGSYGHFWSSTRYSGNRMHRLRVSSSSVDPADSNTRSFGYSVRCILK